MSRSHRAQPYYLSHMTHSTDIALDTDITLDTDIALDTVSIHFDNYCMSRLSCSVAKELQGGDLRCHLSHIGEGTLNHEVTECKVQLFLSSHRSAVTLQLHILQLLNEL